NSARVEHVAALTDEISRLLSRGPADEWTARLDAAGIPCGRVARISDLLADEHLLARRMILPLEQPGVGAVPVPGIPIKASGFDDSLPGPAPGFGEHGVAIARDLLGYDGATLQDLQSHGALLGG
ncbi:MAG: CoA transferase, partial [Chloroflexota bacterium]|nr:CoA transferase [Chloroflexota bacterium]